MFIYLNIHEEISDDAVGASLILIQKNAPAQHPF